MKGLKVIHIQQLFPSLAFIQLFSNSLGKFTVFSPSDVERSKSCEWKYSDF